MYAPDVEIFIARDNKQYDVSRDIVSVAVQRNENAFHAGLQTVQQGRSANRQVALPAEV